MGHIWCMMLVFFLTFHCGREIWYCESDWTTCALSSSRAIYTSVLIYRWDWLGASNQRWINSSAIYWSANHFLLQCHPETVFLFWHRNCHDKTGACFYPNCNCSFKKLMAEMTESTTEEEIWKKIILFFFRISYDDVNGDGGEVDEWWQRRSWTKMLLTQKTEMIARFLELKAVDSILLLLPYSWPKRKNIYEENNFSSKKWRLPSCPSVNNTGLCWHWTVIEWIEKQDITYNSVLWIWNFIWVTVGEQKEIFFTYSFIFQEAKLNQFLESKQKLCYTSVIHKRRKNGWVLFSFQLTAQVKKKKSKERIYDGEIKWREISRRWREEY